MSKKFNHSVQKYIPKPISQRQTRELICENCKEKKADVLHHVDYKNDITVPLCYGCHRKAHFNPKHKFHPIDGGRGTYTRDEYYNKRNHNCIIATRVSKELRKQFEETNPYFSTSFKLRIGMQLYMEKYDKKSFFKKLKENIFR